MITYIKINGFKSFQDFEMSFTPLTVIAGANASGKSNLFDAFNFLSRLAETDLKTAFSEQRGSIDELFTQYGTGSHAEEMSFTVEMLVNRRISDKWGGNTELNYTLLRYRLSVASTKTDYGFYGLKITHESLEKIKPEDDNWVKMLVPKTNGGLWKSVRAGGSREAFIRTEQEGDKLAIKIRQDGKGHGKATPADAVSQTVLSGINSVDFPHALAAKEEMRSWKFLQLNPDDLREPTKQDAGIRDEITATGNNLAAALFRIKHNDPYALKEISRKLNSFLPNFVAVDVVDDKANRQFIIRLQETDDKWFSSRVLSEGTLRLLALCILSFDDKYAGLLCFEEPENGISPYLIKATTTLLKDLSSSLAESDANLRQVIVNTHSPGLLSALFRYTNNADVSVWMAGQNSLIKEIMGEKTLLKVTRVLQIPLNSSQLLPFTDDRQKKITLNEAIAYLNTVDSEGAKDIIKKLAL